MGNKKRRARLARGIDHVMETGQKISRGTEEFYDLAWVQGQLKAAIRVVRQMDAALTIYEEDFHADIVAAVEEVLNANDQPAGAQGSQGEKEEVEGAGIGRLSPEEGDGHASVRRETEEAEFRAA